MKDGAGRKGKRRERKRISDYNLKMPLLALKVEDGAPHQRRRQPVEARKRE